MPDLEPGRTHGDAQRLGLVGAGNRATVVVGEPVSYTHLRAHETVLDLVCRLLLEKKKYTNNTLLN